jgi:hypothetical protein
MKLGCASDGAIHAARLRRARHDGYIANIMFEEFREPARTAAALEANGARWTPGRKSGRGFYTNVGAAIPGRALR